jgi:hypothetical protein
MKHCLQVFDIVCKCKCTFHFSKGIPKASTSIIVVDDLILIVDVTFQEKLFLPKKHYLRDGSSIECSKMFELVNFLKLKQLLT